MALGKRLCAHRRSLRRQPEDALRGIVLLRADLDEKRARELAEMDPRVKAGQLNVEIRDWYTGAGILAFPQQPE